MKLLATLLKTKANADLTYEDKRFVRSERNKLTIYNADETVNRVVYNFSGWAREILGS